VTNDAGLADFEIMRRRRVNAEAVLVAFDLLELNGEDLRGLPIEQRKRELARLLRKATSHIVLNEHFDADGAEVYRAACQLGCEGIVSKKLGSPYRSGRSDTCSKLKIGTHPPRRECEKKTGAVEDGSTDQDPMPEVPSCRPSNRIGFGPARHSSRSADRQLREATTMREMRKPECVRPA
jgi:hypothetical protein